MTTEKVAVASGAIAPAIDWVKNNVGLSVVYLVISLVVLEQLMYRWKSKHLPGPSFVLPFVGCLVDMVTGPFRFWHKKHFDKYQGGYSWDALLGKFMVITSDAKTSRTIFEKCSDRLPLVLHPNALLLLDKNNMAFLNGPVHRNLRQHLLPLFSQKALGTYLKIQEGTTRRYIQKWLEEAPEVVKSPEGMQMRQRMWDLNTTTSLEVFIGPYLTAENTPQFKVQYKTITEGFLSWPINLPGTGLNKALHAKKWIIKTLTDVVIKSKARMRQGVEPSCLLDYWMEITVKEEDEAKAAGKPAPLHSDDEEIARHMLDFLFASQDASTSSLTWVVHILSTRPDVLAKVRAEQMEVRVKPGVEFTTDLLGQMPYTWQVMKELLRYRPPATIVPHQAQQDFPLENGYTAPKGTLVVPSIWNSNRVGYSNPESFDPDRFSAERGEDKKFATSFLTFGAGPHYCLGQRYAMNHLMLVMGIFATETEFKRKMTPNMEDLVYLPTIYPADDCPLEAFGPRKN